MATQVLFLTLWVRPTLLVGNANQNKSREYHNDENLIKSENGTLYEVFGWYLESVKREQEKINSEIEHFQDNVTVMKEAIETHGDYAEAEFLTENINLLNIIDYTLRVHSNDLSINKIEVVKNYSENSLRYI